jgi:glycosyltransferase involved in cell wall biosynthesis
MGDLRVIGRLFVCDPACVQPFGHNVVALKYFRDFFMEDFSEVRSLCCRLLPDEFVRRYGFVGFYDFYYQPYFPAVDADLGPLATGPDFKDLAFPDRVEMAATADAERLLQDFSIGPDDSILFPHLDFYGVVGLMNALAARRAEMWPQVFLRFIGVMENATATYREPLLELCSRIAAALDAGLRISVSAETPRYADRISELLGRPVSVTGYPEMAEQLPLPAEGPFVFYSPGSARHDKGFGALRELYAAIRRRDEAASVRLITQMLPDHEQAQNLPITSQLYATPGVELLPSQITEAQMISTYRRSHAVLLPYDAETYRLRGSAVLMEAAFYGRPAVALEGTAFADQIRYYGLGVVAPDIAGMAEAALSLAATPRDRLEHRARQARHRYVTDNAASFRQWLSVQ